MFWFLNFYYTSKYVGIHINKKRIHFFQSIDNQITMLYFYVTSVSGALTVIFTLNNYIIKVSTIQLNNNFYLEFSIYYRFIFVKRKSKIQYNIISISNKNDYWIVIFNN